MTEETSKSENSIDVNLLELVNIAANTMDQIFVKASKESAKPIFKTLKSGKKHHLGKVKIAGVIEPTVSMSLDYSEFRGPGFNFDVYMEALLGLLSQLGAKFQAKEEMKILSGEHNSHLIHVPSVIKVKDQYNVLVLAIELGTLQSINFRLMFVDPGQYETLNKEAVITE